MKPLINFWKRDMINKLIVLITVSLLIGAAVLGYLLTTIKSDSMLYLLFPLSGGEAGIPTLAVGTVVGAEKIPPSQTSSATAGALTLNLEATATPASQTITVSPATFTPVPPTQVLPASTATSLPVQPTNTPVPPIQDGVACIPQKTPQVGKVLDVIDGNTVKVLIDGNAYVVRYIGIDVPQYKPVAEYFGQESDFKNAELVFAKEVTLIADTMDKDDSGRLLRYVTVEDIFVNLTLISQGFATVNSDNIACANTFKAAQQQASQSSLGLWKPTPTIPSP